MLHGGNTRPHLEGTRLLYAMPKQNSSRNEEKRVFLPIRKFRLRTVPANRLRPAMAPTVSGLARHRPTAAPAPRWLHDRPPAFPPRARASRTARRPLPEPRHEGRRAVLPGPRDVRAKESRTPPQWHVPAARAGRPRLVRSLRADILKPEARLRATYSVTRGSVPETCMTLAMDSGESDSSTPPSISVASPTASSSKSAAARGSLSLRAFVQLRRMISANCRKMRMR